VLYPAVQLLRAERGPTGLSSETLGEFVETTVLDPMVFYQRFQQVQAAIPQSDLYTQALAYLGTYDELTGRFLLIANTDVVVNAVNTDGPYGIELLTMGLEQIVPTFLYPGKPREDVADIVTWYYGLRDWYVVGAPTTGIFADSYACAEWTGVVAFPFLLIMVYFFEVQLAGGKIFGNFLTTFFLFNALHPFPEMTADSFAYAIIRTIPIYYALILGCIFIADMLAGKRVRQRRGSPI
jgi:hypothetical protein